MTTLKEQKLRRERQRAWRQRHADRLRLVSKIEANLMRQRDRDIARLSKLIAEVLDESDRKRLKRML